MQNEIEKRELTDIELEIVSLEAPALTRIFRVFKRDKSLSHAISRYSRDKSEFEGLESLDRFQYNSGTFSSPKNFVKLIKQILG